MIKETSVKRPFLTFFDFIGPFHLTQSAIVYCFAIKLHEL